jgi:hypothetical protein
LLRDFAFWPGLEFGINDGWHEQRSEAGGFGIRIRSLVFDHNKQYRGAKSIKRGIQTTVALIGEFPESGRLAREQSTRVLPAGRYPYLIYWTVVAGGVSSCISATRGSDRGQGSKYPPAKPGALMREPLEAALRGR